MLKQLLYQAVDWIAMVHDKISRLNDQFEGTLSDKQMHFLVIGSDSMIQFTAVPVDIGRGNHRFERYSAYTVFTQAMN